jgi:regulator of protease activity HflC (stomatin/prohibitin superfamily)
VTWFVISLVLIIIGIFVLSTGHRVRLDGKPASGTGALGGVLVTIGMLAILLNCFTVIPARNVGVVNTFGVANQALDNGIHFVAPWSSIETIDATVQNINRDEDTKNCVTVRLANQTTACVDLTLQWNIDQNANANELWQRYRGSNDKVVENVGNNVVMRELQRALNVVFETYNPLGAIVDGAPAVKTADLAKKALDDLKSSVDKGIVVDALLISVVHFDATTQDKLNAFAQSLADTRVAEQNKKTAEQQRAANDLLVASSSDNEGVKYQNCLNVIKDLAAKNQLVNLPAAFTCGPGGSPVLVQAK